MSEKHVVIATFTLPTEAHIACGRLRAEGIEAHVTGDGASSAFAGFGGIAGRVELYVPESACERALDILAECIPEEQWRVMFGKDTPLAETNVPDWPADERVKTGTEFESEGDARLWVCSLCGDAVPVEETVCPACGTAREAVQPTKNEPRRKNRRAPRTSTTDVQKAETIPAGPALDADLEMPKVGEYPRGDVLADRALASAVVALFAAPAVSFGGFCALLFVTPLFALIAYGFLLQMMLYTGELSPKATRKFYIALALDVLTAGLVVAILWPFFFRSPY
jgi:hypothetical protein